MEKIAGFLMAFSDLGKEYLVHQGYNSYAQVQFLWLCAVG